LFYGAAQFVFITLVMLITTLQPYKPQVAIYNAVDSVLVLLMALVCASAVCISIAGLKAHKWLRISILLLIIVSVLPLFYISFVTLHWICCRRQVGQRVVGKIRGWIRRNTRQIITADSEESLPDRLINPAEYDEDLKPPV